MKKCFAHFHLIDKNNYFLKELFRKDFENRYSRECEECNIYFSTCRKKNSHSCFTALQTIWWIKQQPLTISKKKQFNNNLFNKLFSTQKPYNFYNAEETIKDVISAVENKFISKGKVKVQGFI